MEYTKEGITSMSTDTTKWQEFSPQGTYLLHTPNTPGSWKNVLFNDEYVLNLSQRLTGVGSRVENIKQVGIFQEERSFFLKTSQRSYRLFAGEGTSYEAEYDLGSNKITETFPGTKVQFRVLVPTKGKQEAWSITVENTADEAEIYDLFCHFPFVNNGPMGGECRMDESGYFVYKFSFPYHVFYEDMEKVKDNYAYTYIISNRTITSYAGSAQEFWQQDNPYALPLSVEQGNCTDVPGEGDDLAATLHFRLSLAPGEKEEIQLLLGSAVEKKEIQKLVEQKPAFDEMLQQVRTLWQERCEAYHIETPFTELNHLCNRWFLKQAVYQSRLNRSSVYCPVRNQLQDALGYSMVEPEEALKIALKVLRRQHRNGYLKQWYMVDGSPERDLCKIEHSDACIWLLLCITEIIQNTGDKNHFSQVAPYMDDEQGDTVLEHLKQAARYMYSQVGTHGLCLFKDGDWTDPINGAGRGGKGESVWNSMALIFAIRQLTRIFPDQELQHMADEMEHRVNTHCWDGSWYIAGFDDEGKPFGCNTDAEAQLFLNTQTWAFIAGIVPKEKIDTLVKSIESLRVPFGYRLLSPAFSGWNPTWGRISIKQKGTTENGSVYCHASMFKALGDCMRGDTDAALDTILMTLPVNPENPPERNLQLPLYVPNYYFGEEGPNFGKSSCHSMTGSNAWLLWVMLQYILGIKTTVDGIHSDSHLPQRLQGTKVSRKYRGEIYYFSLI